MQFVHVIVALALLSRLSSPLRLPTFFVRPTGTLSDCFRPPVSIRTLSSSFLQASSPPAARSIKPTTSTLYTPSLSLTSSYDTFISSTTTVEGGELRVANGACVRVDGCFVGRIVGEDVTLIVGYGAKVTLTGGTLPNGSIKFDRLFVSGYLDFSGDGMDWVGEVNDTVECSGVAVGATGCFDLKGRVGKVKIMEVEKGGRIVGQIDVGAEEAKRAAEEEARVKEEGAEARRKTEEEAQAITAEKARVIAEEAETLLKAQEEARIVAAEEARVAEEEVQAIAAEKARVIAKEEAETLLMAQKEARVVAAEEARVVAETLLAAEEDARLAAEELARLSVEEEARIEARAAAEDETRAFAEQEARAAAEEGVGAERVAAEQAQAAFDAEEARAAVAEVEASAAAARAAAARAAAAAAAEEARAERVAAEWEAVAAATAAFAVEEEELRAAVEKAETVDPEEVRRALDLANKALSSDDLEEVRRALDLTNKALSDAPSPVDEVWEEDTEALAQGYDDELERSEMAYFDGDDDDSDDEQDDAGEASSHARHTRCSKSAAPKALLKHAIRAERPLVARFEPLNAQNDRPRTLHLLTRTRFLFAVSVLSLLHL